jgi:hypothetical protein
MFPGSRSIDHFPVANVDAHVMGALLKKEHEITRLGIALLDLCDLAVLGFRIMGERLARNILEDIAHQARAIEGIRTGVASPIGVPDLFAGEFHKFVADHLNVGFFSGRPIGLAQPGRLIFGRGK